MVSEGFELEANGELVPGWQLNGGYAYNTNEYEKDVVFGGRPFTRVSPEYQVKLFTNYQPPGGSLRRLSIGGGITWFSETTGGSLSEDGDSSVTQGAYTIVDLRLGYDVTDNVSVSAQINNLFEKNYYGSIGDIFGDNYYGAPRNALATIRTTF